MENKEKIVCQKCDHSWIRTRDHSNVMTRALSAAIPGTAVTCHRPTWSADTALCHHQSSSGATSQTVSYWWPGLQCRWSPYLEPAAGGDHVSTVFVDVPSASQDIPLREIISWCNSMKLKRCRLLTFLLLLSTFLLMCFFFISIQPRSSSAI